MLVDGQFIGTLAQLIDCTTHNPNSVTNITIQDQTQNESEINFSDLIATLNLCENLTTLTLV